MSRSTLLWTALCLVVVIGLFVVKHRVQDLEDRLHALNAGILANRDATQVLEAEWSYLNQPARLEELSRRLLGMEPLSVDQTLTLEEFRLRVPPEIGKGTAITNVAPEVEHSAKVASGKPDTDDWLQPILLKVKKVQ